MVTQEKEPPVSWPDWGFSYRSMLRCVCDCYRLCILIPENRASKILSHKSQRKHGPAVDDLGDHLCVRRIDESAHAIHGRSTLADSQSDGLLPKRHCYFLRDSIPANSTCEGFDDCTYRARVLPFLMTGDESRVSEA